MNRSVVIKSIAGAPARLMTLTLVALGAAALAASGPAIWRSLEEVSLRPHAPDWVLFLGLPLQVQVHVGAAIAALAIGTIILLLPKGKGPHKALGWSRVVAMATTAASSLFITGLNGDLYSAIHLLTGWTLIALPMAVVAIRKRNVMTHRRMMTSLYIGGLVLAGLFSFIPGRFMFEFLFG